MNRIDELREQIDACRAGSDDLHLPELAGLAQAIGHDDAAEFTAEETAIARELDRSQRFDRSVVSALHDVSVPAGLLERLLEKSTAAAETSDSSAAVLHASVSSVVGESVVVTRSIPDTVVVPARSALSRRGWLMRTFSLAVVAAGLVGLAVVLWPTQPRTISQTELAGEIPGWVEQTNDRTDWANMQSPPPAAFPVTRTLARRVTAWRSFRTNASESAVAYELSPVGGKVRLFVVKTPHKYAVPATPSKLQGTTGGVQVSAWQPAAGLLYVLFIDRDGPRIEEYLPRRTEA